MPNNNNYKCFIPLTNFESEFTSIELAPGYLVREMSQVERNMVKKYNIGWPKIAYGHFAIECTSTEKTLKQDFPLWGMEVAEKVVLVLRLYKEGIVGYNVVVSIPEVKTRYRLVMHRRPWVSDDVRESKDKYKISRDDTRELQKFFPEFIARPLDNLNLAARYFSKSYEEDYAHDSFVDLIIASESLYLKGETLELGYKLAMRISHVLEKDPGPRKCIFNNMRTAYKLRGDIVHGEKLPAIDARLHCEIRQYVRKSLQIFIKDPSTARRKCLDDIVLGTRTCP